MCVCVYIYMFTSYIYTYADTDAQIQYIVTLHYMKLHDITVHCIALHCNTSITDKLTDLQTYRHLGIHTYIHTYNVYARHCQAESSKTRTTAYTIVIHIRIHVHIQNIYTCTQKVNVPFHDNARKCLGLLHCPIFSTECRI